MPALALVACAHQARASTFLPDFGSAKFVTGAPIDNLYLPWEVGARSAQVAKGVDEDSEPFEERDEQKVLGHGPTIRGVKTTTVIDKGFENGALAERTRDYYAQDTAGNVWYMGEDSTAFEYDDEGELIGTSTEGSWRAGRNGALPGYAMPANPDLGLEYYQEFALADHALDKAKNLAVLDSLRVGGTIYRDVLQILETTDLDPGTRELKYYAPYVGLIRVEEGLDMNLSNPEVTFNRVAPVPLPPGLLLLGSGVLGLLAARRRQRTMTLAPM